MGLQRCQVFALIAIVACAVMAGPAVGAVFRRGPEGRTAGGPITHPDNDYAGSGLAGRRFGPVPMVRPAGLPGLDVSSWQGDVDWVAIAANGGRFAYIKATEGT